MFIMTIKEFSDEFDTLINSYNLTNQFSTGQGVLSFDEYEKSVFLTKAQEDIIKELYSGKNQNSESFEKTEEVRRELNELVETYITTDQVSYPFITNNKESYCFKLPNDVWFIIMESAVLTDKNLNCKNGITVPIVPITHDEYSKIINNPFRGANDRRVLRLDINNNIVEIVSKYNVGHYFVRYLKKPSPIILVNLPEDLKIDGVNTITECTLNSVIHRKILERAIQIAISSKSITSNSQNQS